MVGGALPPVIAAFSVQFVLATTAPHIQRELGFGERGYSVAISAMFAAGAIVGVPAGAACRRLGAAVTLRLASLVAAVSLLLVATAQTLVQIVLAAACGGVAIALVEPASATVLGSAVDPTMRGVAFGLKQASIPTASLLVALALPAVETTLGWRGIAFCIGLVAVVSMAPVPNRTLLPSRSRRSMPRQVLRSVGWASVAMGFGSMGGTTLAAFLPSAALSSGLSSSQVAGLLAVSSVIGIGVRIYAGVRADRTRQDPFVVVALLLCAGGVLSGIFASEAPILIVLVTPAAYATAWGWPGLLAFGVANRNRHDPGGAGARLAVAMCVGAVAGPAAFGLVVTRYGYSSAWFVTVASLLAASVAALFARGATTSALPNTQTAA